MLAQEKVPKEKCTRSPHRLTPVPCGPRPAGGTHNSRARWRSLRSDRVRACIPAGLRYSVRATGLGGNSQYRLGFDVQPLGAAEHRSKAREKLAPCLSESSVSEIASCASAGLCEKRREPALAGKPLGPPFFWVLFFGGQRKVPRLSGRDPI